VTTEQIRLRLTDEETHALRDLSARCGLAPTALAAVFVRAALRAVTDNQENIPMSVLNSMTTHVLAVNIELLKEESGGRATSRGIRS